MSDASSRGQQGQYTGVVLIHGLGPIRRNGMLEQSLNALSYWFNHTAQLAVRPEGPGRIWLAPELTDDPDPDQPASRASVELVAPDSPDSLPSGAAGVRLEFREVWWAESFGLPDIGATIAWARLQWREQAAHLLIPIGKLVGPSKTAARTPARQTPQALTYRPAHDTTGRDSHGATRAASRSATGAAAQPAPPNQMGRPMRAALRTLLWLYDLYQYLWKGVQWLFLTPVITLLLIVMGIVRVLAVLPFLRPAIIATFQAITNNIMLHWVSEIKVYLTDYTRASAIRQRFAREVEELLRDLHCDRVVVIAESGGTYIAYEGLTTLLAKPDLPLDDQGQPKPVTFVSIATALRRIWLLAAADPHRVHGVLPQHVKWMHFWARYDPVAAGPLTTDSLPPITTWDDPTDPNPYDRIRTSLAHCENVAVVNTDSTFTDHVSYWDNLEQVVGPIAYELVAGHPALEQVVQDHLASRDDVLLRRWSVAWRYTLAFAASVAAGLGLLVWAVQHPAFGDTLTSLLRRVDWGGLVGSVCAPCKAVVGNPGPPLPPNPTVEQFGFYARAQAVTYLFTQYVTIQALVVGAIAVAVMALTHVLVGRLAAKQTFVAFPDFHPPAMLRLGGLFATSAIGVGLIFLASLIFSRYVHQRVSLAALPNDPLVFAYIWALGLGELIYTVSFVATLVVTFQQRQWGWLVGVLLSLTLLTTFDPFYRTALLAVAVVGCLVCLTQSPRPSGASGKIILAALALMSANAGIGVTLADFKVLSTPLLGAGVFVEYLLPPLIYALWSGRLASAHVSDHLIGVSIWRRTVLGLAPVYLGLATLLAVPYIINRQLYTWLYSHTQFSILSLHDFLGAGASSTLTLRAFGVTLAVFLGATMLLLSMADALRQRRWAWLLGIPLLFAGLAIGFDTLAQLGVKSTVPEAGLVLSFALAAAALMYALWAGPTKWRGAPKPIKPV
jgi:hypothetical protein